MVICYSLIKLLFIDWNLLACSLIFFLEKLLSSIICFCLYFSEFLISSLLLYTIKQFLDISQTLRWVDNWNGSYTLWGLQFIFHQSSLNVCQYQCHRLFERFHGVLVLLHFTHEIIFHKFFFFLQWQHAVPQLKVLQCRQQISVNTMMIVNTAYSHMFFSRVVILSC